MEKDLIIEKVAEHLGEYDPTEYNPRKIRKSKRLSQQKASELAGISRYSIILIEKGQDDTVKLSTLRKLLTAYGKELVIAVKDI